MADPVKAKDFKEIPDLVLRSRPAVRVINLITLYRIVTFPLLIVLIVDRQEDLFKWLLLASFFTDAIDGFLARRYKATSILGSKLDSIGDDLTILAAATGLGVWYFDFVREQALVLIMLLVLFLVQLGLSIYRYRKFSTFHTYLAKTAAVITAAFLLSVFFFEEINYPLFYFAAGVTAIELIEEIILAAILREYRSNVKGLYWVLREKKRPPHRR